MSDGQGDQAEAQGLAAHGSKWLEQSSQDETVVQFQKLSVSEPSKTTSALSIATPLAQEAVWLKQLSYESAEALYFMHLAGTAHLTAAPGTPAKRQHTHESKSQSKKQKHDQKNSAEIWSKKLTAEGANLLKTVKVVQSRLEDLEKAQQQKTQAIQDASLRITSALEECKTKLNAELAQSTGQITALKSLLSEVSTAVDKTTNLFTEKQWSEQKTPGKWCQKMSATMSKLGKDLSSSADLCNCFQANVSKSDINRIVGEISRFTLLRKNWDGEIFSKKNEIVANSLKLLVNADDDQNISLLSDSDSSLEGSASCSGSSDGSENDLGSGKIKTKKMVQNGKKVSVKTDNGILKTAKGKPGFRPGSSQTAPIKRNAQGMSTADRKADIFQFKGISRPTSVPFVNQPGLLGPRPNVFPLHVANPQTQFRFSQSISNFAGTPHNALSAVNRPGFGNVNFNFSGAQPRSFDLAQNSALNQQARNNQLKQNKQFQVQQEQLKAGKKQEVRPLSAKPAFPFSFPRNPGPNYVQNSQPGLLGSYPGRGSVEQQLNDMAQKIQQMQLATSHNLHLQHLMQETDRLKQLVAHKQHQQQDRFQQQFQLLINAFMQQQRQQQFQAPESKMARAVQLQAMKQQQHKQLQQYKKRKQQQSKGTPAKPDPQKLAAQETTKADESSLTSTEESTVQNGEGEEAELGAGSPIISKNSRVTKIGAFSPQAQGDKHNAGVSSLVVMENIGCVVVVDIINSCLKLYNVSSGDGASPVISHHLVTRLELSRPYYIGKLNQDMIVVSREGKLLSSVRVSRKRLEFLQDIKTESQYYGLGFVTDNTIVCAAFADNRIDLVSIHEGVAKTSVLLDNCKGPELVAAVPNTGSILFLERVVNNTVNLLGISQDGQIEFSIDLQSSPKDVWSMASITDRIVCANKQSGKVKLFSDKGVFLGDIRFPIGTVNQPFAMAFCDSGNMYIANDGAWDEEYEHYVTTEINMYSFS